MNGRKEWERREKSVSDNGDVDVDDHYHHCVKCIRTNLRLRYEGRVTIAEGRVGESQFLLHVALHNEMETQRMRMGRMS